MVKAKKFLKWYKILHYVIGGFSVFILILSVPKIANPFIMGLFTTLGGSLPLLIIIYFFHYLPIKREGEASISVLKQKSEYTDNRIRQEKNLMKAIFGTEDYIQANNKIVNSNPPNEQLQKILLDLDKEISNMEMQNLAIQLEITYKTIYSFDKYIYDIFHRKFFGLSDHEKYWNLSSRN